MIFLYDAFERGKEVGFWIAYDTKQKILTRLMSNTKDHINA